MKRILKYFAAMLTALFILSLLSCQTIKLNSIEKQYSQEFRQELESIEDKEKLTELLNNENEIEVLYNSFLKLESIEDEELKMNIENELESPYFETNEEKINFVSEVINLNHEGMMTNYLFNNDYLNNVYNPSKKIT